MVQEYRIQLEDDAELFCRTVGTGEPLLLIHGSMVDADFLAESAEHLAQNHFVITYDRRGYSRSTTTEDHSLARQARDAAAVLEHFSVEKADITACSSGGLTALQLAKDQPHRIQKLVLFETPATGEETGEPYASQLRDVTRLVERGKLTKAKLLFLQMLGTPDPEGRLVPDGMVQSNWENGDVFLQQEFPEFSVLTADRLRPEGFDAGQIIMGIGTDSGKTYFSEGAKVLAEAIGCRIRQFPGCHNCAFDRPDAFAHEIEMILKSHK